MDQIINFLTSNDAIHYMILPALLLNILVDICKKIILNTPIPDNATSMTSVLVLLGGAFGVVYYNLWEMPIKDCFVYSLGTVVISYLFYELGIWDMITGFVKKIFHRKMKDLDEKKEE